MKFSATLLVLAAVAAQTMAVIPIPVKGCKKTVVVKPSDSGCIQFATDNHITFQQLLAWNMKLRPDCANLDVGGKSLEKENTFRTSPSTIPSWSYRLRPFS